LVSLAMRVRGGTQRDMAALVPPDAHLVVGCEATRAARLDVRGYAAPAQTPARCGIGSPLFERRPLGALQGLVEHAFEIAAVVFEAGDDAVGKPALRHEVAATELRRIHAELVCGLVHQPL